MIPTLSVASDHAGFVLKTELCLILDQLGVKYVDHGPQNDDRVDYPDFAALVGRDVQAGKAKFGLLVCGSGIGMAISANKIKGVRAAAIVDEYSVLMSRKHNDLNVLCLGSRVIGLGTAQLLLETFLNTPFEGDRHQERVNKIHNLENT